MNNYKITIQYDGTRYKGWQGQNSTGLTIQGKIEAVLGQMAGHAVEVIGSGRTDAGVHAKGQVANFHIEEHFTEGKIMSYLNHYLPDDIAVIAIEQVDERFHSRYAAKKKTYRYHIHMGEISDVFERKYEYQYEKRLDVESMKEALASVQVKGRMEEFESKDRNLVAIVDYAHNRLSFEKLYDSVYKEYPGYEIYTVFGCPGDKALNRRRDLGLISGLFSNRVYLTTDDPGTESVTRISEETGHYVEMVGCPCECIEDRALAIHRAIQDAGEKKTVVLVLGKGSEGRQRFGNLTYDCPTDSEMVRKSMNNYDRQTIRQKVSRRS